MSCEKKQTIEATITEVAEQQASVRLHTPQQQSCHHCQTQGGCRSLSLYQLLFANQPIYIQNQSYHVGQTIQLQFPDRLILQAVGWLLGLPLAGFILGVLIATPIHELAGFALGIILAVVGIGFGKRVLGKKLGRQLLILP